MDSKRKLLPLLILALLMVLYLPTLHSEAKSLLAPAATTYYVCECATGADGDCEPGDDGNSGTSPTAPWQTYEMARSQFGNLVAGDAILFCRGGGFDLNVNSSRWVNQNCTADNRCTVGDYQPPWGSGDEARPILLRTVDTHAFALEDGGNAEHEEGYILKNLDLRCSGCSGVANGVFLYNDIDDVLVENIRVEGFGIGVHLAGSNPCSSDPECDGENQRLVLRGATIINNGRQGFLGGGDGLVIEDSYFENNGSGTMFDHNIYISSGSTVRISGNELYRSSLDSEGLCRGVSLVGHGTFTDLIIENNFVHEPIGQAGQGCWGIAIDPAYDQAERFEDVIIRGNQVVNVGNLAIGVGACVDCLIENNVIVHQQDYGVVAIAVPDRDPGSGDAETTNATVRNNSILISSEGRGIRLYREGTSHQIVSNAVHYTGDSSSWACLQADLPASSYEAIDYNVCGFEQGDWAAGVGDLTAWQALGWGIHSQAEKPGFTSGTDLSPVSEQAAVVGAGHPTLSSPFDITGRARDESVEAGAYEFIPGLELSGTPGDQTIYLNWDVNITLPATTTWTIGYDGTPGNEPSPITGIPEASRAYTLTGVTNYEWYIITLSTDPPMLTDTVRLMPTDLQVYLPLIMGE